MSLFDEAVSAREAPAVRAGRLPPRYARPMQATLVERLRPLLVPGAAILDVGGGRNPALASGDRPPRGRYVGLDRSRDELTAAPSNTYDEAIVADVTLPLEIDEEFDVAISWQVLEHVKPLAAALENVRTVLRPGGTLLAQVSGSFAIFALAARAVPHEVRVRAMARLLGHSTREKFRTHYDHCYDRALRRLLASWSAVTVIPFYRGATYLEFSRPIQRLYLAYESAAERRGARNLATHYLVVAVR